MFRIICMGLGYNHEPDFLIDRKEGYPHYLALLARTPCRMRCGEEIRSYPPGTFILFDADAPQFYAADGKPYQDDWIQFSCDREEMLSFGIPYNQPMILPEWTHPEQYFSVICSAFYRGFNNDRIITSLLTAMLADFSATPTFPQMSLPFFCELVAIRQQIGTEPQRDWHVEPLAKSLHVSVSYFHRIYKEAFHISLTQDVIRSRLNAAKNLLQCTGLSTEQIAIRCGYTNAEHFSRQFKKHIGISPDYWRRQMRK